MIEYLSGKLIDKTPSKAIILAGGVGYAPFISLATYERLPAVGEMASLFIHLVVREDSLTLFGFSNTTERDMFLLLTSVTGVGPKIAVNILSSVGVDVLRENIARGNALALTKLPGIGKKIAERIALELRDKIGTVDAGLSEPGQPPSEIREEALAALMALGYNRQLSEKAIRNALKGGPEAESDVQTLIKLSLKHTMA
jgi:Holliday junction DNA helicase RuvA